MRELLDGVRPQHQPQGAFDDFLVLQMAIAGWRLRRVARFETGVLEHRLQDLREDLDLDEPDPDPNDTEANQQFAEDLTLLRYENVARRAFYKAFHELKLVRARTQPYPGANIKIDETKPISPAESTPAPAPGT